MADGVHLSGLVVPVDGLLGRNAVPPRIHALPGSRPLLQHVHHFPWRNTRPVSSDDPHRKSHARQNQKSAILFFFYLRISHDLFFRTFCFS